MVINKLRWKLANWLLKDELRKRTMYIRRSAEKCFRLKRDEEGLRGSLQYIIDEVTKLQSFAEGKGGGSND